MGLGIKKMDEIFDVAEIPLDWENNAILANHFRMLADYLEETNMKVYTIGVLAPIVGNSGDNFSKPTLEIRGFIKEEKK